MFAQIKEALTALIVSAFSKKFIAFVTLELALLGAKRWNEAIAAFVAYSGIEVADKKIETKPAPVSTPAPLPPEATPAPEHVERTPDEVVAAQPDLIEDDEDAPPDAITAIPEE